jgi:hypothetical protein
MTILKKFDIDCHDRIFSIPLYMGQTATVRKKDEETNSWKRNKMGVVDYHPYYLVYTMKL